MTGGDAHYDSPLLFTNLQIGSVKLFSAGSHDGKMLQKEGKEGAITKLFFDEKQKIIGAILYKDTSLAGKAKKWIKEHTDKSTILQVLEG